MMEKIDRPALDVIRAAEKTIRRRRRLRLSLLIALTAVIALAAVACLTVARPCRVTGSAMSPTLEDGQLVLVNTLGYEPSRGEITLCSEPAPDGGVLLRRIAALSGARVIVNAGDGTVQVNGLTVWQPVSGDTTVAGSGILAGQTVVPSGYVYLISDNPADASDSRSPLIGLVPVTSLVGRVWARLWPDPAAIHSEK